MRSNNVIRIRRRRAAASVERALGKQRSPGLAWEYCRHVDGPYGRLPELRSVSIFSRLMQENASTSRINSADAKKSSIWILANSGDSKRKMSGKRDLNPRPSPWQG